MGTGWVWEAEKRLEMDSGNVCTTVWMYLIKELYILKGFVHNVHLCIFYHDWKQMLTWHFLYAKYCSHFFANVNTFNINNLMRIIVVIITILAQQSWDSSWHFSSITSPLNHCSAASQQDRELGLGNSPINSHRHRRADPMVTAHWESPKDSRPFTD